MKTAQEFKVGKHDIGWISSSFFERLPKTFTEKEMPRIETLTKDSTDAEIEETHGLCELGHILAFLKNPPEGTKGGYFNIFYTESCVVDVYWSSGHSRWDVDTWYRGVDRWHAGHRVLSPATDTKDTQKKTLGDFDALTLRIEKLEKWKARVQDQLL